LQLIHCCIIVATAALLHCCCNRFFRFKAINGLLLPGGGASLRPGRLFYDTAARLVQMAIEANDRGDYFPVSDSMDLLMQLLNATAGFRRLAMDASLQVAVAVGMLSLPAL
jgi:hypothetical protein